MEVKPMKKNVLVLAVVAATLGGLTGCKKGLAAGSQINIMCWNNEFQGRFNAYYPDIDTDPRTVATSSRALIPRTILLT
jgi:hypothetical protein